MISVKVGKLAVVLPPERSQVKGKKKTHQMEFSLLGTGNTAGGKDSSPHFTKSCHLNSIIVQHQQDANDTQVPAEGTMGALVLVLVRKVPLPHTGLKGLIRY